MSEQPEQYEKLEFSMPNGNTDELRAKLVLDTARPFTFNLETRTCSSTIPASDKQRVISIAESLGLKFKRVAPLLW